MNEIPDIGRQEESEEYLSRYFESKFKKHFSSKTLRYSKEERSNIQAFTFVSEKNDIAIEYFSDIPHDKASFAQIILTYQFLISTEAKTKIIVFTEREAYEWFLKYAHGFNLKKNIEILFIDISN